MKKEKIKLPKDYWICNGCNRKVNTYYITTIGNRCLNCVINNNLTFLLEDEYQRRWINADWFIDNKQIQGLEINKSIQQNLNKEKSIENKDEGFLSSFLPA